MRSKIAIYTCLVGGYDSLEDPEAPDPRCDYICFSNDIPEPQIGVWQIRRFPYENANATRASRFPKLQPHAVLPEYEYSLYIDANQILSRELQERVFRLIDEGAVCGMVVHPERDCVYQEAYFLASSVCGGLSGVRRIFRMVRLLVRERYPEHFGLYCCCAIFRKHHSPEVMAFSDLWWDLYCRYSHRDQMSANYALWKVGLTPAVLWGRDFFLRFSRPHRRIAAPHASLGKKLLSYGCVAWFRMYYRLHGISLRARSGAAAAEGQ